jgi:hypothetical protein
MATQSTPFSYITFGALKTQLAQKLNNQAVNGFWSDAELGVYIVEALRFWNVLTSYWPQEYTFTLTPPLTSAWSFLNNTSTGASPRAQTLTVNDLYTILCYHLMERSVTNLTSMFTLNDFVTATQQVRDEILLATAANMGVLKASITPGTSQTYLPDSTLDVRRMRYTGAVTGVTNTLVKGDSNSFMRFSPGYRQSSGTPGRFDVIGSPPLALAIDIPPNEPNSIELLVMNAGATISATNAPLQIPDDWMPVLKWGVLFELLSKEAESTDHQRASYAKKRYEEGLRAISSQPWLLNGFLNNQAADIVPVIGKDRNSYNWQSNPSAWPSIVVGGVDLVAPCPIPTTDPVAISLTVVANAPIPVDDGDSVQVSRDALDAILDYAQHLAAWKQGGDEAEEAEPLYQEFVAYAMRTNARLRLSGIFATDLRPNTSRQDLDDPRFAERS